MGHAVPDEHVELVVIVLDGENHCHRLTDLDESRNFRGPRSLSNLNAKDFMN
jgi:hypothetical protein